jgi:hypothetical protein
MQPGFFHLEFQTLHILSKRRLPAQSHPLGLKSWRLRVLVGESILVRIETISERMAMICDWILLIADRIETMWGRNAMIPTGLKRFHIGFCLFTTRFRLSATGF